VEELLETLNEPHTVIFRFSSTQVDSLVISYLARQDEKTRHDLIKVSEGTLTTHLCSIRDALGRLTHALLYIRRRILDQERTHQVELEEGSPRHGGGVQGTPSLLARDK
jgi:hypothetical protein